MSAVGIVPAVGDSAKATSELAKFVAKHTDDTALIINMVCQISDEIEIFEKFLELYPKLIEEKLPQNECLIKSEYDNLNSMQENLEDLLNDTVKERKEKFEIASSHECVSSNCFVAGTLVTTADSKKPIEQIKIGDKVLSQKENTNQIAFKQVTNTFVNETNEIDHIHVNGETISATPNHPFYVDKLGWQLAKNLRAGDVLALSNGEFVTVEWVQHEILENPVKVYNFEVEDYHTYFVGENSVLVHNDCDKDKRIQDVYNKCGRDVGKIVENLYNKDQNRAEKFLEIFENQVKEQNNNFFNNLSNSTDKEKAIDFIIDYSDDGFVEIFSKHGDKGIEYTSKRGEYALKALKTYQSIEEAEKKFIDSIFTQKSEIHFNTVEGFNKEKQGIKGGHTLQSILNYSNTQRKIEIVDKIKIHYGIYTIKYKAAAIDAAGNIITTVDNNGNSVIQYVKNGYIYEKTAVDLTEISYNDIKKKLKMLFLTNL